MQKSAKQLCALLITRSLNNLTEDEEDLVVDYLEDLGIETDIDMSKKDLCLSLLNETMKQEIGKRVPITAYANQVLGKEAKFEEEKKYRQKLRKIQKRREKQTKLLESQHNKLPGCIPDESNIISREPYKLNVDPDLGINNLPDDSYQYSAVVSVPDKMYEYIFLNIENPVLEITSNKGFKGYARITENHKGDDIKISPLVASILDIKKRGSGFLKLCMYLPEITKIGFSFYGTQEKLDEILSDLIVKLPSVINAFSYLSLGLVLKTMIDDKEVLVRVDELYSSDNMIFAGLIPSGESDIPFDVVPDL